MIILGLSAFYHDSAATLVVDGKIVAAAQEERFSRVKHDPAFPRNAILYCLEEAKCDVEALDAIIFYDKPMLKFERLLETYLASAPRGFLSFLRAMPVWLKEKLYLKNVLRMEMRDLVHHSRSSQLGTSVEQEKQKDKRPKLAKLLFSEHHQSHAASAFFPSPFEKAAVLCLDGVGEWATSTAWLGEGAELKPLWEIQFPHSLGLLYSAFTSYCGFRVNSGEYKLMGLAPYGEPKYVDQIFENLITVNQDGSFALDMSYFDYAVGDRMTNKKFDRLFGGPAKRPDHEITQKEMDLARSIQVVTEEIILKITQYVHQQTGCENLCLAGGVALNCVANGRILREGPFKHIWIQPAAGDAGGSLGAALVAWYQYFGKERRLLPDSQGECRNELGYSDFMQGSYLGPAFSSDYIEHYLCSQDIKFKRLSDQKLCVNVAELIDQGQVIGWFQGRMEFGPRALGNRSIIGDPRNKDMQRKMNLKIKQRESFRPFAPVVKAENVADYFDLNAMSPYMLLVAYMKEHLQIKDSNADQSDVFGIDKLNQIRSSLPAITHVDYSARVQTVHKDTNALFHQLISEFEKRTGIAVLINTSFNVRGEPPVCTPEDAVRCFLATEIDYLVLGNYVLEKQDMNQQQIQQAKQVTFAPD